MGYGETIREALRSKGKTARWLANELGVSEAHISLVLSDKRELSSELKVRAFEVLAALQDTNELPNPEFVAATKAFLESSAHYGTNRSPEIKRITRDIPNSSGDIRIPLYWQTVPAGDLVPMVSDSYDEFNVTKRYDHTFAVYIRGDSMVGAGIEDDDIAVFREQDHARNGQVVYACVNGMCTVKVYRNDKEGTRLVPANPKYAAIPIKTEDELVIRGVLLNIVREPKLLGDI